MNKRKNEREKAYELIKNIYTILKTFLQEKCLKWIIA